jgi:cyclopropane fatty-acyl-phospholipid synthase-like methyltransferase
VGPHNDVAGIDLAKTRREQQMFTEKDDCAFSIRNNLRRTAHWREVQARRFNDERNLAAAAECQRLAEQVALTDDEWDALKPHFAWTSKPWSDALRESSRKIGFRYDVPDFPTYVRVLCVELA